MLFAGAAVVLVALVVSQLCGRQQLLDLRLLTHRPFVAATIAGFGTGLGVIALMSFACSYFVDGLALSALSAAALLAAWSGTSALTALVLRRHTARIPGTMQLVTGLAGTGCGLAVLASVHPSPDHVWITLPGLFVAGLATGVLNGGLARQAVATVPAGSAATGTGTNNTARYLGATVGVSAASVIATKGAPAVGWAHAVWSAAAVSVMCAVVVALLSIRRRQAVKSLGHDSVKTTTEPSAY